MPDQPHRSAGTSSGCPIEDYAFIGDTSSAALVSKGGSIDWLCLPRFDSPALFAALLDRERGGHWLLAPAEPFQSSRSYRGDTMVLETRFETADGVVVMTDCLPIEKQSQPLDPRAVVAEEVVCRQVRCERGSVRMVMDYRPRFDYGSVVPWFRAEHGTIEAVGGPDAIDLLATIPLEMKDRSVEAAFVIEEGHTESFVASYHPSYKRVEARGAEECSELIANTEKFWTQWVGRCSHEGRWRDAVVRSLLTLKALTYAPSGGVAAAATTSLPEQIGGPRNWDYRFCWLRDATFTLDVLLEQGFTEEAEEWRDWLLRAVAGDPEDLQIMYGLVGERRLHEVELDWLSGYEASRPVRIGNAAFDQFQLDVYGEVMDSLYSARRAGIEPSRDAWELQEVLVDFVCERWKEPDEGIWEVRSGRRHFVHSKVMAWVAVDRAIKTVQETDRDGDLDRWTRTRDEIRDEIFREGVHDGRFKRAYDENEVDASLLMLPLVGFIEATDPVMRATIEAVENDLMRDGFLLRYESNRVSDGLPAGEGAFLMCTFWLVDCLVLLGRFDDAEALFERLLGVRNDLGLLAEQFSAVDGRLLGNFPQAFSHVALVASARALQTAGGARSVSRGRRDA